MTTKISVPKGLKKAGRDFYKKVLGDYALEDCHDLERLQIAAKCLDDIHVAEEQIERDGSFVTDRYSQVKEHPAGRVIRDNRTLFCRVIRELGLDLSTTESRIPGRY